MFIWSVFLQKGERYIHKLYQGLTGGSDGKEPTCSVGHLGLIPGLGQSHGGENGNPHHYYCLKNTHGQRSLVGYSPWGRKELDTTERISTEPYTEHTGTDLCSHGEFRLHMTWVRDIEKLSARKMRKCIHWGFYQMALLKMAYTHPRLQMKYSRMLHDFLTKYHTTELPGPDTKKNQGLNLSLVNSQVPAMTAFMSITNTFFSVKVMKVLSEPEPKALQIPLDHTEGCRGSVVWNDSHSAIWPGPWVHWHVPLSFLMLQPHWRWVGVLSGLWGWQSMSFFFSNICDVVTKSGFLLPTLQKPNKRPASQKEKSALVQMLTTGWRVDFCTKAECPTPQLTFRNLELYRQTERAPCRNNRVKSDSHSEIDQWSDQHHHDCFKHS